MDIRLKDIEIFIKKSPSILIKVQEIKGSTPRETDAFMLVNEKENIGTIGGGNVEFLAIKTAQKMLKKNEKEQILEIALGKDSAQCCGGFMKLNLQILDNKLLEEFLKEIKKQKENLPHIYLFGAGHVGKALANLLSQMPFETALIDSRKNMMQNIAPNIKTITTPLPESIIRKAKSNSAFIVFTHDHGLDFLLLSEILNRNDFSFAGMIGSKIKRKKFENFYLKNGGKKELLKKITCPIGGDKIVDKRPSIIAALTLGEIISNIN